MIPSRVVRLVVLQEKAILEFIAHIENDAELNGKFNYRVNIGKDGKTRVHWGKWDDPITVEMLQSRDFFKTFAAKLQEIADNGLSAVPLTNFAETSN